jgi:hypothetical protein
MQRMTIGLIALMFAIAALPVHADDRPLSCCGMPILAAPALQKAGDGNRADAYHAKHPARIAGVSSLPSAPRPIGYSSGARGLQRAERRLWRDGAGIPGCAANGC